jgi:hypothetical protein
MKKNLLLVAGIVLSISILGQHQELTEKPDIWKDKQLKSEIDSTSLLAAFKGGTVHGHFRYYFSATDNHGDLTDYYANAGGGGLKFTTANFHGFEMGISGFYIFNLGSSNLAKPDSTTSQSSRYEVGLFDIENPENKYDIDRLEELFIRFRKKSHTLSFGKLLVNSPFVNLQDGRMRPSGAEGLWMHLFEKKRFSVEGGFLYGFSPRSTTRWYRGGESIGVYPTGVNVSGTKSLYQGNVESKGLAVLALHMNVNQNVSIHLWDFAIENVLNTVFLESLFKQKDAKGNMYSIGLQLFRQDAIGEAGNSNPDLAYTLKSSGSAGLSARVSRKWKTVEWDLNYTRISKEGRYLFPREWGRDPFYTFLPRERNEGFGDVHAANTRISYKKQNSSLKTSMAFGYYDLPDVKNVALNKYGVPSYFQMNVEFRYTFKGFLQGLEAQVLVVGKKSASDTYDNEKYVFNKVDMLHYNLVLNYHF